MRKLVSPALVLRHADFGDYDRMVTLLTPEFGRLDAAARGCRRMKSPIINATEMCVSGEFSLTEKNGRYYLDQCQITEGFFDIRGDYERLVHAAYWMKLLEAGAPPDVPAEGLFQLSVKALAYLCYSGLSPSLLTLAFEAHFMAELGYSPRVDCCVVCGAALEGEARFDSARGGAVCSRCVPNAPEISYGARRILYRLPATRFESVEKLADHADRREAALFMRAHTSKRVSILQKFLPPVFQNEP